MFGQVVGTSVRAVGYVIPGRWAASCMAAVGAGPLGAEVLAQVINHKRLLKEGSIEVNHGWQ